jgi:hypothetical protein
MEDHRHESVPDDVVARAKAALETQASGPLAALVFDSALEEGPPAAERRLRFVFGSVCVEMSVTGAGAWRTIRGQVVPGSLRVQLEREGTGVAPNQEVAEGHFGFGRVPRGLMRLRLDDPDGSPSAHSEWFLV